MWRGPALLGPLRVSRQNGSRRGPTVVEAALPQQPRIGANQIHRRDGEQAIEFAIATDARHRATKAVAGAHEIGVTGRSHLAPEVFDRSAADTGDMEVRTRPRQGLR